TAGPSTSTEDSSLTHQIHNENLWMTSTDDPAAIAQEWTSGLQHLPGPETGPNTSENAKRVLINPEAADSQFLIDPALMNESTPLTLSGRSNSSTNGQSSELS